MWVRKADYDWLKSRVEQLELLLAEERAENRRVERHWGNMILRRGGSLPMPHKPIEQPQDEQSPQHSESDLVKVQAVIAHGKSMQMPETEIIEAVQRLALNFTEAEIASLIRVPVYVSSNGNQ